MDYISIIGSIAGTLTTISFIPQVYKVVTTKQTRDISLWMFIIFSLGVACWLIYGILIDSLPIIIANAVTITLAIIILVYKLRYK